MQCGRRINPLWGDPHTFSINKACLTNTVSDQGLTRVCVNTGSHQGVSMCVEWTVDKREINLTEVNTKKMETNGGTHIQFRNMTSENQNGSPHVPPQKTMVSLSQKQALNSDEWSLHVLKLSPPRKLNCSEIKLCTFSSCLPGQQRDENYMIVMTQKPFVHLKTAEVFLDAKRRNSSEESSEAHKFIGKCLM